MQNYSTKELRKRKALTDAIVANLKVINTDGNDLNDLEELGFIFLALYWCSERTSLFSKLAKP